MNKVLITGGTGVVGSATAPFFLNDPDYEVWLLIRASSPDHLEARKQELISFWGPELSPSALSRLKWIVGDVTSPSLGLEADTEQKLLHHLTHIVHAAASVQLDLPLEESRIHSVKAVENMLNFLKKCPQAKLEYISTVGVNGRNPTPLQEIRLSQDFGYFNTYEAGKAEAERHIFQAIDQGSFITVHRPSMVVGDSQTGKIIHFQVFHFLLRFLSGQITKGILPRLQDAKIDTIPSDFVGKMLYESAGRSQARGEILHLCSGPQDAKKVSEFRRQFRDLLTRHGVPLDRISFCSPVFFQALAFAAWFPGVSSKWQSRLRLLPQFIDYANHDQTFMNDKTRKLLPSTLAWPKPDDYLGPVMEYFVQKTLLRKK